MKVTPSGPKRVSASRIVGGRLRQDVALPVVKWARTRLPTSTVRASPSFESVSVTGTPAALASVRMMAVPSNTSSMTVASIVFDAPAAGRKQPQPLRPDEELGLLAHRQPVRVEPAEPAEGRVEQRFPVMHRRHPAGEALFSPTKEATKAVRGWS